jgi:hypothetical protein
MNLSNDEVQQRAEANRREVDPPIPVETVTWSKADSSVWKTAGMVGSGTRCRRPSAVDPSCRSSYRRRRITCDIIFEDAFDDKLFPNNIRKIRDQNLR